MGVWTTVSDPIYVILFVITTLIYNHFLYARYQGKSTLHVISFPLTSTGILRGEVGIISPILQMRILRIKDIKALSQSLLVLNLGFELQTLYESPLLYHFTSSVK